MLINLEKRELFRDSMLKHLGNKEVFALHPKYNKYAISNLGRVKNLYTGKILKSRYNRGKYHVIQLREEETGKNKVELVSRLVLQTFLDIIPEDYELVYEANHINGNKNDNTFQNLNWLTRKENLEHAKQLNKGKNGSVT